MHSLLKERNAEIMKAYGEGKSPAEIGRDENLSAGHVCDILRAGLGLKWGERLPPSQPRRSPVKRMERAMTSLRHGGSLEQAAKLAGMTPAELDLRLWNMLGGEQAGRVAA